VAEVIKKPQNSETLGEEIAELTGEIEGLRAAYEQYFLGIERKPPTDRHEKLKKRINAVLTTTVRQTAVKFKAATLNNKMLTYERLWARTLKEIEDGTYKRDLFKAKLRHKEEELAKPPPPPPEALKEGKQPPGKPGATPIDPKTGKPATAGIGLTGIQAAFKPGGAATSQPALKPGAPGAQPHAPVSAGGPAALSDQKMRAIYDAYVTAKKRCNEDVSKLSYESVATTLRQQVPALIKQHNAKSVEFKVVIKDGKAVLRALPKE
jgi:hypothetical protein